MPGCFKSTVSPVNGKKPRNCDVPTGSQTFFYKLQKMSLVREIRAQKPSAFARMRHLKLKRHEWHGGTDSPGSAYLAEPI